MNPHNITPFAESILPRYFVALDLETTGLMPNRDRIVEIAALKFDIRSNNHQAFSVLIKQDEPIPSSATEIHGITDSMCAATGVSLGDAILGLYNFIGMHPVVCHNFVFDIGFLEVNYDRLKLEFKNDVSCTLKMARMAFPKLPSYSLEFLIRLDNKSRYLSFHRAMDDAIHTARLYLACVEILKKLK